MHTIVSIKWRLTSKHLRDWVWVICTNCGTIQSSATEILYLNKGTLAKSHCFVWFIQVRHRLILSFDRHRASNQTRNYYDRCNSRWSFMSYFQSLNPLCVLAPHFFPKPLTQPLDQILTQLFTLSLIPFEYKPFPQLLTKPLILPFKQLLNQILNLTIHLTSHPNFPQCSYTQPLILSLTQPIT